MKPSSKKRVFPPQYTENLVKAHGRLEQRSIQTIHIADGDLYLHGATTALRITRYREDIKSGKQSPEVVYCLTCAAPGRHSPEELLQFNRNHWGIETSHHIRDVTFQEDSSRKRIGATFMAALRSLAIGLMNILGMKSFATSARKLRYALLK